VPPVGGDTLFASQYAAYDALSPRMKAYLQGLTATHSGEHLYRATNVLVGRDDRGKVFPKASHPIIRTHPVTKRKALFVNQGFTTHIDGLPQEESRAILNYLFEHTALGRNSRCGFAGGLTRSRSGTIAAFSTWRCGIITPRSVPAAV
jgi:taurine dioxygenase